MKTKTTNRAANRPFLWKLLQRLFSTAPPFLSFISRRPPSVRVLETDSNSMNDVRMGLVILLRTREDDDANVIAVKNVVTKLWSDGSMPLLVSLNAEALVVYYYEKMVPDSAMSPSALRESVLMEYNSLAVFIRMVKAIKKIYFDAGWLDEPQDFLS
jgi:hypothetical protein